MVSQNFRSMNITFKLKSGKYQSYPIHKRYIHSHAESCTAKIFNHVTVGIPVTVNRLWKQWKGLAELL